MNPGISSSIVFFLTFALGVATQVFLAESCVTPLGVEQPHSTDIIATEDLADQPVTVQVGDHEEIFTDDRSIGRRKKNKVVLRCFESDGKSYTEISFYTRVHSQHWIQRQHLRFEKDGLAVCAPELKDFNNDGLRDLVYGSHVAARGANRIQTLLIYDKTKDELKLIRNSTDFPNLDYNKELNCIGAWALYGASTTYFLRLEGDSLRKFASVDTGSERVVTITRRDGTDVIVRRETMNPDDYEEVFRRFNNYNPPR